MIPGVISSRTCLLPMITPESYAWLRLHTHYKEGYLPRAGGILDQPNKFMEAMEVLNRAYNGIRRDEMERQYGER